jgi:hypothetical protein
MKSILPIFGVLLFSLMTLAMLFLGLFWSGQALVAILFAILFGGLTVFSLLATVKQLKGPTTHDTAAMGQERARVLRLAASKQGRLTAEETALGAHISVQEAQALLDDLVISGTADTWITDNGRMVYVFGGLLDAEDKQSAEDPLKLLDP